MDIRALPCIMAVALVATSCSFGPRLQTGMPVVRDVPVLAGLGPSESLARARTYLSSRQYGLAIELFRAAGRDPALEVDSLNGLAIAYDGIGRGDLAERYFQKALALRSDDARTRRNLATFYATSGQQAKHRALLADAAPATIASPVAVDAQPDKGLAALSQDTRTDRVALRAPSPLGDSLRPMLVKASFSDTPPQAPRPLADDTSVICLGVPDSEDGRAADASVKIFRLSVGEIFITTEADGADCSLAHPTAAVTKPQAMSNADYLGLVAAYLDQLNRLQHLAYLVLPARTGRS